jgi:hypothetical protein
MRWVPLSSPNSPDTNLIKNNDYPVKLEKTLLLTFFLKKDWTNEGMNLLRVLVMMEFLRMKHHQNMVTFVFYSFVNAKFSMCFSSGTDN